MNSNSARRQTGSMILESMIALLVFSLGILGVVGLQAASIKASSDAKYRSEASLLANELIGRMWVSDRTPATLQANFASATDGADYRAWAWAGTSGEGTAAEPTPGTVLEALPSASAYLPTISIAVVAPEVVTVPPTPSTSLVTVTVFWLLPGEPTPPHKYTAVAQIGG